VDHGTCQVRLLTRSNAGAFGVDGQLFLGAFAGRVRAADVAAQEQSILEAAHGGRNLAISWIGKNLTLGERGRKRVGAMLNTVEPHMLAWAIVIPPGGFWSSIARTIASTARLLSRTKYPFKVFDEVDPACVWLRSYLDEPGLGRANESLGELYALLDAPKS
jgi:hypothetical protein